VRVLIEDVVLRGKKPPMPLNFREIKPGTFFDADDFTITAIPVSHRGPDCLGYVFEGKARRPFLPSRADELGVPFGPERRDLVAGQAVTLSNGKRVKPDEVLGPLQKGLKLVVIGDTGKTDDLLDACKDADALVIESTYLNEEAEMAREFSHLTAQQAAELAVKANVKKLILTHISRRYREKDVLKEAQAIHPDVSVARDFDTFTIKRDEQDGQD
ncbi:MAG TPA: MBL fold metallo-hydrolase, partial [Anaerolineales bacterium]|nr:MBL fold metallo-hydrolase [Anaerolineales bacterium]